MSACCVFCVPGDAVVPSLRAMYAGANGVLWWAAAFCAPFCESF